MNPKDIHPDGLDPLSEYAGIVYTRSELAKIPKPDHLIAGVLEMASPTVFVGSTGVGKTFTVVDWGCCIATGRDWHGRKVRTGPVLIVIGEGASGLDDRLTAWELFHNRGEAVPDAQLRVVVKPKSLKEMGTWQWIAAQVTEMAAVAVFLDTFSSLGPDVDETKDAAVIMRRLSDLATGTGAASVLVHHPGWSDNSRTRGGSELESNADGVLIAKPVDGSTEAFTLTVKKAKDGPDGEVIWLRRSTFEALPSLVVESSGVQDATVPLRVRLLDLLNDYGQVGATGPQLCAETGTDGKPTGRSTFFKAIRLMEDDGEIAIAHPRTQRARYYLTKHAPEDLG